MAETSNQDFATFLRAQRRRCRLSQAELARRAQISERTVRYWESGASSPGRWELESLLTTLGLTPQERIQTLTLLATPRSLTLSRQEAQSAMAEAEDVGPMPSLGDLLRAMRQRKGLTLEEIAASLKIARSSVLRWESADTLPSEENLKRICVLLKAYPEESAALTNRRLPLGRDNASPSLEESAAQVVALDSQCVGFQSPLIDLRALTLKRQLWMMAGKSEDALRLLGHVQVIHASWLRRHERNKEAEICIQRGLNILEGNFASDPFLQAAVNLSADFAGEKKGGNLAAVQLLKRWVPIFPKQMQTTLWCDIALYAAHAQQHDAAAYYLTNALDLLPYSSEPEKMSAHYYPLTRARTFLSAGRPAEALKWLPSPSEAEPITFHTFYHLLWAETLLGARERNAAQGYITRLTAALKEHPQSSYQRRLDALAARL